MVSTVGLVMVVGILMRMVSMGLAVSLVAAADVAVVGTTVLSAVAGAGEGVTEAAVVMGGA